MKRLLKLMRRMLSLQYGTTGGVRKGTCELPAVEAEPSRAMAELDHPGDLPQELQECTLSPAAAATASLNQAFAVGIALNDPPQSSGPVTPVLPFQSGLINTDYSSDEVSTEDVFVDATPEQVP